MDRVKIMARYIVHFTLGIVFHTGMVMPAGGALGVVSEGVENGGGGATPTPWQLLSRSPP